MRLTEREVGARERLIDQVLGARTREEVAAVRAALEAWLAAHPDDPGMVDGLEHLAQREHALDEIARQAA